MHASWWLKVQPELCVELSYAVRWVMGMLGSNLYILVARLQYQAVEQMLHIRKDSCDFVIQIVTIIMSQK